MSARFYNFQPPTPTLSSQIPTIKSSTYGRAVISVLTAAISANGL